MNNWLQVKCIKKVCIFQGWTPRAPYLKVRESQNAVNIAAVVLFCGRTFGFPLCCNAFVWSRAAAVVPLYCRSAVMLCVWSPSVSRRAGGRGCRVSRRSRASRVSGVSGVRPVSAILARSLLRSTSIIGERRLLLVACKSLWRLATSIGSMGYIIAWRMGITQYASRTACG